jgi:hypothetical protein
MIETYHYPEVTDDLILVHKGGNEYVGLMTIWKDGEQHQLDVNVVHDGKTTQWSSRRIGY